MRALLLMLMVAVSGCASLHDSLQGRWTVDLDAMLAADEEMRTAAQEHPEMIDQIREQMRKFSLVFGETSVVLRSDESEKSGTYEVISEEGETITIRAMLAEEPEETLSFYFKDDDHVRATTPGDDPALHLRRVEDL